MLQAATEGGYLKPPSISFLIEEPECAEVPGSNIPLPMVLVAAWNEKNLKVSALLCANSSQSVDDNQ